MQGGFIVGWLADLLKEIPSAARYAAECEKLESENDTLKAQNAILRSEVEAAKKKIGELEKQLHGRSGNLSEIEEKILQALAQGALHEDDLAKKLGIGREALRFHAEELQKSSLVDGQPFSGLPMLWRLEQEGRKYLMMRGLLE